MKVSRAKLQAVSQKTPFLKAYGLWLLDHKTHLAGMVAS
jgi:hypothetical protein